jgi:hypothetical protein
VPSVCGEYVGDALELFVAALESGNRQLFQSVCCALKSVSKGGRPEIVPFVARIFAQVIGVMSVPAAQKELIDETGLRYSDCQSAGLKLARRLIGQLGRVDGLGSFLAALARYAPTATSWECRPELLSTLKVCCFHSIPFLQSVFAVLHSDPQVWHFIAELVSTRDRLDDTDKQILCSLCLEWVRAGEYTALRPLSALILQSPRIFPIEFALSLFEDVRPQLTVADACEFIDLFRVFLELGILQSCDANVNGQVILMALELVKACVSCAVPPAPIRFLNALIVCGFEFDQESLGSFIGLFAAVAQGPRHLAPFWEETMVEIFRVVLSVMSLSRACTFDWEIFLAALPAIVPLRSPLPVSDLYASLARLSSSSAFRAIANGRFCVFTFFAETLALGGNGLDQPALALVSKVVSQFLGENPGWREAIAHSFPFAIAGNSG